MARLDNGFYAYEGIAAMKSGRRLLCMVLWPCCLAAQQAATSSAAPAFQPVSSTVVVLGSPEPVTEGQAARSVVVLDPQQHPLAFQTPEDYLRTDSSVDIQQRGAAGVQSDISIRGASFEQTLVLVNGLRINDAETSHFNLDLPVPLDALTGIDVLHGAGSTLYGSDAIGGVVDFLTAKPEAGTFKLRGGFGSFGENQQGFLASALGRTLGHAWSGTSAGSRDFSTGFMQDRDYRSEDASTEGWLETPLGTTDVLLAGSDRPFGANQFYGNYDSFERTKGWFASLRQQLGGKMEAAFAYRRHSDIFVLLRDQPLVYKNQHIDESWEGALRRRDDISHYGTVFYGLEADTDAIQSNNLGHHGRNQGAGYLDVDLHSRQRAYLSAGLREEVLSGCCSVLSPTLAGSVWALSKLKLRASLGYGFRLPTYVDLYYSYPSTRSNPKLKPESAWNYDGGADWYLNTNTAASVTIFYSRQSNAIDYVRTNASQPWQATNLTGLRFSGVESSLQWHPLPGQQLKFAWTLLSGAQSALHGMQSEYIFNYPIHNAVFEWTASMPRGRSYGLLHGLLIDTRVHAVQRYHQDAYPVWDVSVAREAGRLHPYLQMMNLSNTGYQEILGVAMPGRSFAGGVELTLGKAAAK